MALKGAQAAAIDYEAYFEVSIPSDLAYMHNVLLTFASAIPEDCRQYCTSAKHPSVTPMTEGDGHHVYLRDFVEERLLELADYEYRGWINGQQPFVTPRELQIWRLRQFVQYIWFWNLPDDEELAMIFNLTKRRAANLGSDFSARFRKTIIYPVALRRLYHLINVKPPFDEKEHPKAAAAGFRYRVPSRRIAAAAENLVDDLRVELPRIRMATPFIWDRDINLMWIDKVTVDVMKTNEAIRRRLYDMYKLPE